MDYELFDLEDLMDGDKKKKTSAIVKDYVNMSTEIHVHITVQFEKGKLDELENTLDTNGGGSGKLKDNYRQYDQYEYV